MSNGSGTRSASLHDLEETEEGFLFERAGRRLRALEAEERPLASGATRLMSALTLKDEIGSGDRRSAPERAADLDWGFKPDCE